MDYHAPLREMKFIINEVVGLEQMANDCALPEVNSELSEAILEEAAKLAGGVLAPLNRSGDKQGASWHDGKVTTAQGWIPAYHQFREGGWIGLAMPTEYGGQGMPNLINAAVLEMWMASNMAFSLGPMLTTGAVNALLVCASDDIKTKYLPKMVSGQWAGTMNLTEPQAGSDLAAVRTRAEPQADGSYRIVGQKIFITYGDHDMTENIIHLVLARLPDAPPGVKGISLFLVPKFKVGEDGKLGAENDMRTVSIEHKLGIHASPTCVLQYGDNGGAEGYLLGEANRGLEYMFVMMNEARFGVGMQGIAIGERAFQSALAFAKDRVQGRDIASGSNNTPIIRHPDVARLLLLCQAQIMSGRLMAYHTAELMDRAHYLTDAKAKQQALLMAELLIPIVKGWNTEKGIQITSLALQVYGGMGFIEETGAAQHYRDSRITSIYEGTTAIQANDLLGRKMGRDQGATLTTLAGQMQATAAELASSSNPRLQPLAKDLLGSLEALAKASQSMMMNMKANTRATFASSVPLLMGLGDVVGAWQMAKAALVAQAKLSAQEGDSAFYQQKVGLAEFYFRHVLPHGVAELKVAGMGGESVAQLMDTL
jgi:alkylation response protein AidB-like acyl-CoA dehydrogenase